MFDKYIPDIFEKTVYEIDFEKYYKKGYRAIIFDIDNTLVLHDAECNKKCIDLIVKLKNIGFKMMVLSNNHLLRTKTFCDELHIDFINDANKPFVKNYLKAIDQIGIAKEKCLFVGDQLFTDIRGAKEAGITSILVRPIGKEKYFHIKVKRFIEKIILFIERKSAKNLKIDFDDKAKICYIATYDEEKSFYEKIKTFAKDKNCDMIELRLDTIYDKEKSITKIMAITNKADRIIKRYNKYSLATFRTKQDGSNIATTKEKYYDLIYNIYHNSTVNAIDIEYRYYRQLKIRFNQLTNNNKSIVLSFHEFTKHYDKHYIQKLLKEMMKEDVDIVKIAIFTHKKQEVFDIMEESKKIKKNAKKNIFFVIIAMGKMGLVSRIYNEYTNTKIIYIDNDTKDIGPIGNINIDTYYQLRKKIKELI